MATPIALLLLLPALGGLLRVTPRPPQPERVRWREGIEDKLELRESVIYQVQLAGSWRIIFNAVAYKVPPYRPLPPPLPPPTPPTPRLSPPTPPPTRPYPRLPPLTPP